MMKS